MKDRSYFIPRNQHLSDLSYNRLFVIGLVILFAFILLALKLIIVVFCTNPEDSNLEISSNNFYIHRKEIIDRNGTLLAVNLSTVSLYAKPKYISDHKEVAKKLVNIFPDLNYKTLIKELETKKNFLWIKRNISPKEQYAVNNLGIPSLDFEKGEKRMYLQENLLSHVLGYVDIDGVGIAGVEKQFDKLLSQKKELSEKSSENLQLSIDLRIQNIVHSVLTKAMHQYQFDGAAGIVMDVNNGEIYSLVSLPDFDPNNPGKAKAEELFNRATLGVFELGSILKICTMAMVFENKTASLNDVYYVKAPIQASKFTITDYHSNRTWLTLPEIFMHSSNIGTGRVALEIGTEEQKRFLKKFHLTDKLSIELPEKGMPIIPASKDWSEMNTITISYGYGIAISPMHFTQTTAALINGGYFYNATLVKNSNNDPNKKIERIVSEDTSEKLRKLMRLAVQKGSGRRSEVKGYFVGGKTGSANIASGGGYNMEAKRSSYISAFPMHDPKYVIMLMLDSPRGKKENTMAGRAVTPIAKEIIEKIGPVLGVKPENENDESILEKLRLEYSTDTELLESF